MIRTRRSFLGCATALAATACRRNTGGTNRVTIMQSEAPRTMDPGDQTETYTAAVLRPIYESLLRFDQNLHIVPGLAIDFASDKVGTTWELNLRSGVYFHDGTLFNAEAAAASFERLIDPKRGLAASSVVRQVVSRASAVDGNTLRFELRAPYAAFPSLLAITMIVSPTADGNGELGRRAVGTGPYRFAEWKTGEYVLEERNERYWGGLASVEQIKWTWTSEPALMNMAVLAGEADLVNPLPPVFAEALQRNKRARVIKGESSAVFWVGLNTKEKPLDDVRVRRALNYATDRESLIRSQLRGYGTPANSPLAPADFAYNPQTRGYAYDTGRAAELLSAAGYSQGFTLNIAVQEPQVNIAEALQGMWAKVGVSLIIQQMESGVFAQAIFGTPEQKAQQGIQCILTSWASGNLDADHQLGPLYRTASWSPAGANLGFYSNPQVDNLLAAAASELDIGKRKALYFDAQQMISDDAAHVLLYYARDLAARRTSLSGCWLFPGGEVELEAAELRK